MPITRGITEEPMATTANASKISPPMVEHNRAAKRKRTRRRSTAWENASPAGTTGMSDTCLTMESMYHARGVSAG